MRVIRILGQSGWGDIPRNWDVKRLAVFGAFSKGGGFSKTDLTVNGISAVLYGDIYTKYEYVINDPARNISTLIAENFLSYCFNTHGLGEKIKIPERRDYCTHLCIKIEKLVCPIPPITEQTAIARSLDQKTTQIDQAIVIKEKQITLLKERKQILIQNVVTRGLNPDAPMRDSGVKWIGEMPAYWEVAHNFPLFTERVEPGKEGLPLLPVSIHPGVSSKEIDEEDKTKYNLVQPNDIVFNMTRAW